MEMKIYGKAKAEMQREIEKEFDRCMEVIYSHFSDVVNVVKPGTIHVRFNSRMRSRGGTANYKAREINLNSRLLEKHPENLLQTFVHELSHILTYDLFGLVRFGRKVQAHGKQWQRVMKILGYTPDRCHSMDASDFKQKRRKFLAKCKCQSHEIGVQRKRKLERGIAKYRCKSCQGQLEVVSEISDSNLKEV